MLSARGHDVVLYCNSTLVLEHAQRAAIVAHKQPLRGDLVLQDALAFSIKLRRLKPDVLLIITFRRAWLAALAARVAGVPRVALRIGLSSDIARNAKYRFVLGHWVDDVVLNAQSLDAPFRASLPKRTRAHVAVIPNGVPLREVTPSREASRADIGIPPGAFVVGTLARLVRQKRIDRLLDAVALTQDVHAIIAGTGARHADLVQHAISLGIAHRVQFIGHTDTTAAVFAALDVYVVASDQEGMSNSMLEAMACGIPVVSTPVSGAREALLGSPECGIVVDTTARAIANGIETMRASAQSRAILSRAARDVVRDRYSTERMTDAWEGLLMRSQERQEV